MNLKLLSNWRLYVRYMGLGLISVSFMLFNSPYFRIVLGIGLLLLGLSFIKRKTKIQILEDVGRKEKQERPKYKGYCEHCGHKVADFLDIFYCKYCKEHHCTKHRLPEDHECPSPSNPYGWKKKK